ncbi:MAG: ribbon-helix-helix domain-containing protein [Propionibacteriaceae bacterium]|nr:ribbon-helix-helix domain-containing protein [Propionibacteriaceae bacterium]
MRTTVRLDPDVASAVAHLRESRHVSFSGAINELARGGLDRSGSPSDSFVQRTTELGLHIDVSNIADALEYLDGIS